MGYNICWVGYPDVPKAEALALSGLRDTGAPSPDLEATYQAAELPNGWSIVLSNDLRFAVEPGTVSRNHAMLMCLVGDASSVYMAGYYVRGEAIWEVIYNGFDQPAKLEVSGRPPPELVAVQAKVRKDARSTGILEYEVPVELARAVCSFRHDRRQSALFTVAERA